MLANKLFNRIVPNTRNKLLVDLAYYLCQSAAIQFCVEWQLWQDVKLAWPIILDWNLVKLTCANSLTHQGVISKQTHINVLWRIFYLLAHSRIFVRFLHQTWAIEQTNQLNASALAKHKLCKNPQCNSIYFRVLLSLSV